MKIPQPATIEMALRAIYPLLTSIESKLGTNTEFTTEEASLIDVALKIYVLRLFWTIMGTKGDVSLIEHSVECEISMSLRIINKLLKFNIYN